MTDDLKDRISNASREQLILMLYDGALRFSAAAKAYIEAEKYGEAHDQLIRAQNILMELLHTLDSKTGGEGADNLASLYTYCYNRLIEANVHRMPEKIDESSVILKGLRDAWAAAIDGEDDA